MKLSSLSRVLFSAIGLMLAQAVAFAQSTLPNAQVGVSYSFQVTTNPAAASGSVYTASGLPPGLGINASTGLITGTPTTAGTYDGTVSVTATTTDSFAVRVTVTAALGAPAITSGATASGAVGAAFPTYTVAASNSPTSFNIGALPPGLSVGGTTTVPTIGGTPTAAGTYPVSLSANNASGTGAATTLTITIAAAATAPVITSATSGSSPLNTAYSYQIVATNSPTAFSASGLPVGLSVNSSTGLISGTPTVAGVYAVTLGASNAAGASPAATLTLVIGSLPGITSPLTANAGVGAPFSYQITASPAATSYNVAGLPAGLSVNATGLISGTPTTAAVSSIALSANNATGTGPSVTLTLNVGNLPAITSGGSASGTVGQAFSYTITASNSPTSFAATGLPAGLAVNTSTGAISGTPTASGTFSVQLNATNSSGTGPQSTLALTIAAAGGGGTGGLTVPITIITQPSNQSAVVGGSASFTVAAFGTTPSYQWQKDGSTIPGATTQTLSLANIQAGDAGTYTVVLTNTLGSVTSSGATLTVTGAALVTPPVIGTQPASGTFAAGSSATLTVSATGTAPLAYQWYKDGAAIAGATNATLVLANATSGTAGSYHIVVRNSAGSATSNVAVLSLRYTGAYFGTFGGNAGSFALYVRGEGRGVFLGFVRSNAMALISREVVVGVDGRFSVVVRPVAPWSGANVVPEEPARAAAETEYRIDGAIGATGALTGTVSGLNLSFSAPAPATTGSLAGVAGYYQAGAAGSSATCHTIVCQGGEAYVLTVSGATADAGKGSVSAIGQLTVTTENNARVAGTVETAKATLVATVTPLVGAVVTYVGGNNDVRTDLEKLVNVSTRTQAGTGANTLIAGFVITGTQPKPVLVRAVGPTLASFNVAGVLSAARLEVFRGQTPVASSNDWGAAANASAIASAATRVGAFALPVGSRDAAILTTLDPGAYTAVVSGQGGATGVSLVEVYDATEGAISRTERIINVSTRAAAGTAESTLIAGFVINGSVPKRVLIRGAGPSLAQFGVTGALARPQLTVYAGGVAVAQNINWSASADASTIAAAATQVGAYAFASGSQDSALILNLTPGAYTAQVTGVGGTTGVALVEVYEVP